MPALRMPAIKVASIKVRTLGTPKYATAFQWAMLDHRLSADSLRAFASFLRCVFQPMNILERFRSF